MSRVWVVFVKELIDGLRDRRAIMSLLLFPLVGPVLVSVILAQTADKLAGAERVDLPRSKKLLYESRQGNREDNRFTRARR